MDARPIDIKLGGREYRVACKQDEEGSLREAATMLDARLREAASRTGASGEKLVMMTALNMAHEFLLFQRADGFDMPGLKRRIELMNARLDGVLTQQKSFFDAV